MFPLVNEKLFYMPLFQLHARRLFLRVLLFSHTYIRYNRRKYIITHISKMPLKMMLASSIFSQNVISSQNTGTGLSVYQQDDDEAVAYNLNATVSISYTRQLYSGIRHYFFAHSSTFAALSTLISASPPHESCHRRDASAAPRKLRPRHVKMAPSARISHQIGDVDIMPPC